MSTSQPFSALRFRSRRKFAHFVYKATLAGIAALQLLLIFSSGAAAQSPKPMNPPALPVVKSTGPAGAAPVPFGSPSLPPLTTSTWTAIGPGALASGGGTGGTGTASGRIAGIAVDPQNSSNIFAAAAGGGVWRSTDGGISWNPLTDDQNTLAMGAIAIAPTNSNRIYAGTGEANNSGDSNFGLGILVSNDGGTTWSLSTGPGGVFNRLAIAQISVDPTNSDIAYAAVNDFADNGVCCANTGIYKTTNGGNTWTNVTALNGKDSFFPWSAVLVDPNTPSIVYAAHGDIFPVSAANGVYRSTDSGTTWTLLAECTQRKYNREDCSGCGSFCNAGREPRALRGHSEAGRTSTRDCSKCCGPATRTLLHPRSRTSRALRTFSGAATEQGQGRDGTTL